MALWTKRAQLAIRVRIPASWPAQGGMLGSRGGGVRWLNRHPRQGSMGRSMTLNSAAEGMSYTRLGHAYRSGLFRSREALTPPSAQTSV